MFAAGPPLYLHAQVPDDAERSPWVNVRVYPFDVWGPVAGWGGGVGMVVHEGIRRGDEALLTFAPAVHESVATLSYASASPLEALTYLLADVRGRRTERQWAYGVGPASSNDTRLGLEMSDAWLRLRVGHWRLDRRLLIQPEVRLRRHVVHETHVGRSTMRPTMRPDPNTALPGLNDPAFDGEQWGVQAGLNAAFDTRNQSRSATRGMLLQASWMRYDELSEGGIQIDRLTADAYGILPLSGSHHIALRLQAAVSTDRGDRPAPFYLLPKLDGRLVPGWARDRFFGADRLVASALYRFPLTRLRDLFGLNGHLGVHAASVYDNLGDQFALDVSFDETVTADGSVPLRPAASVGVRLDPLFRDETYFDLALGISPEGVTGVRLQFTRTLDSVRPPHHNGATW